MQGATSALIESVELVAAIVAVVGVMMPITRAERCPGLIGAGWFCLLFCPVWYMHGWLFKIPLFGVVLTCVTAISGVLMIRQPWRASES